LLEWVNDTSTLRSLIIESHTTLSDIRDFPLPDIQNFHAEFATKQLENQKDIGELIKMYNFYVGFYRPCLHRWFLDKFQVTHTAVYLLWIHCTTVRSLLLSINQSTPH
jgi:hypothetical protein